MMTKCQVPAVLIHQIEEELDKEEGEIMVFLCRDLVPDLATADLRELLMALNEREKLSLPGLSELLYRVKRFDLLRRILKTEKITVEFNLARSPRLVPDYRYLFQIIKLLLFSKFMCLCVCALLGLLVLLCLDGKRKADMYIIQELKRKECLV